MSERRCHTDRGVHIPGCWGCAIYGGDAPRGHSKDRCTCPVAEPSPRRILAEIEATRTRLAELEAMVRP